MATDGSSPASSSRSVLADSLSGETERGDPAPPSDLRTATYELHPTPDHVQPPPTRIYSHKTQQLPTPLAVPSLQGGHDSRPAMTSTGEFSPVRTGAGADSTAKRVSTDPKLRPSEHVYHDSRAATKEEFRRRHSTLQEYYREHPDVLPQLPFTLRHGFKRWKLGLMILFMVFDAGVVPILLYYAMTFGGRIDGYITFAVVTAIWGGPAYVEFTVRSWRLMLKERFYRPLGASSRWAFDITNWILSLTICTTTVLLIVGAAPHEPWLRVLSMPGPALLLVLAGSMGMLTLYSCMGWKAPCRCSSTPKGSKVLPGVYYFVEDIVAVNGSGGLPFREGLAARYEASPVFRKMMRDLSLFWSLGGLAVGGALTVIVCVHTIRKEVVYGVGWAIPFVWGAVWSVLTYPYIRRMIRMENETWETTCLEERVNK